MASVGLLNSALESRYVNQPRPTPPATPIDRGDRRRRVERPPGRPSRTARRRRGRRRWPGRRSSRRRGGCRRARRRAAGTRRAARPPPGPPPRTCPPVCQPVPICDGERRRAGLDDARPRSAVTGHRATASAGSTRPASGRPLAGVGAAHGARRSGGSRRRSGRRPAARSMPIWLASDASQASTSANSCSCSAARALAHGLGQLADLLGQPGHGGRHAPLAVVVPVRATPSAAGTRRGPSPQRPVWSG